MKKGLTTEEQIKLLTKNYKEAQGHLLVDYGNKLHELLEVLDYEEMKGGIKENEEKDTKD